MHMTIVERTDDISHVVLVGRLDTTGAEEISERFSQATAARGRPAIVDLSQIDFMASRGIGVLLANGNKLLKAGHKLVLLNPQQLVESVLRTSRLETVMPIAFDLDEALRIAQGGQVSVVSASPPNEVSGEKPRLPSLESPAQAATILEGQLNLTIKNELSELTQVNATIAQFLNEHHVPHKASYAVNLAIDELVVNVMRYAYVDDDTHWIELELAIQGDQVILRIVDDGRPFDPRTGPALDLHAEERQVGGLGLILVLDMVDTLKYQRVEEKNWVEVRIHVFAEDTVSPLPEAGKETGQREPH